MSKLFSDPTIAKTLIFMLGGIVIVLSIAVVYLASKKYQIYYIEEPETKPKKPQKTIVEQSEPPMIKPTPSLTIEEPKDLDIPNAKVPHEETDTTFIPNMNNVPPQPILTQSEKAPGSKLVGMRISILVNQQTSHAQITSFPSLIGREADTCDVIISEPAVSRRHAKFIKEEEDVFVEDVSEHNGTFLNEMKIPPLGKAKIHEGDHITLGRAHITIDAFIYE